MLRGQLAVVARYTSGKMVDATGVQIAGVLDDLYAYTGKLGVDFVDGIPTLRVWAPTAISVGVWLYDNAMLTTGQFYPMERDEATGVFSLTGEPEWKNKY
jgi:hypothetical protein